MNLPLVEGEVHQRVELVLIQGDRDEPVDRRDCFGGVCPEQVKGLGLSNAGREVLAGSDKVADPDGGLPGGVGVDLEPDSFVSRNKAATIVREFHLAVGKGGRLGDRV
jgi:hypothetical protein